MLFYGVNVCREIYYCIAGLNVMKLFYNVQLTVFFVFGFGALPVVGDDSVKERFLKEYPKAAPLLASALTGLRGTCQLRETLGGQQGRVDAEFAVDHGYTKLIMKPRKSAKTPLKPTEIILCGNESGAFSLKKTPSSPEYVVTSSGRDLNTMSELADRFGMLVKAPYCVHGMSLVEIINGPGFEIQDAREEVVNGEGVITLKFKFGKAPGNTAMVTLKPGLGWAIQHSEISFGNSSKPRKRIFNFDVKYNVSSAGPTPVSVDYYSKDRRYGCDFNLIQHGPIDPIEFGTEYYKLPNLVATNKGINYKITLLIILSLVFFVTLVLLVIRRRNAVARI